MKTSYFTFGFGHAHVVGDFIYDKDVVVKITAEEPRDVMFMNFGPKWAMEYDKCPDLSFYSRGVKELVV